MLRKQTDNDLFHVKVNMRSDNLPNKKEISVLDCFSGDGIIWNAIKRTHPDIRFKILRIDQKQDKSGVYLEGNNLKFMKSINLSQFDIIDLDAYGSPFNQMELIFNSNSKAILFGTFIQSMNGCLNKGLLSKIGYTPEMVKKIPSLFNKQGFDKFCNYLALNNIKTIFDYSFNRKHYFMFNLNQRQ